MVMRNIKNRDRLFSLILIIISVIFFIINRSYPKPSALFPKILLVVLFCLGLILLIKTFISADSSRVEKKDQQPIINKSLIVIAILTAIYIFLLIPHIGYYPSSFMYIVCCYFYNRVSKKVMLLVPICFCLTVYGFFQYLLGLVLP